MVRSPFRYKKPPKSINGPLFSNGPNRSPILILGGSKEGKQAGRQVAESPPSSSFASMFRGIFHPPSSKKSTDNHETSTNNDMLESASSPLHEDEDGEPAGSQDDEPAGNQPQRNADDLSRLPPNASSIVKKYLSPTSREAPNKDGDAFCSPRPGDSDKPSNSLRRAKVKSVYLGGRIIIGESSVPVASSHNPVERPNNPRRVTDTRKRPRTCMSSVDVPSRESMMSSLESLPAQGSEGGGSRDAEDLEAGHIDEARVDRQVVSAPCDFQVGTKRTGSANAMKKRRLSKRARTRLTMREVNTTIQPGRHYSSLESMAHLEKAKALTIPKTADFFRRVEVKLIVVNALLSALITAFVLYAIPNAWQRSLAGSSPAVSVLGAFLSFALVFRTQACYARWWEARTMWGQMTSATINLAGQARAWFGDEDLTDRFLAHCVVFPYACKAVLRGHQLNDPKEEGPRFLHSGMLTDADLGAIVRHGRPPFACLEILRRATYEALQQENGCLLPPEMTHGALLAMERVFWELNLNFGACLKIHTTRMPASYTVFVRSFILFYFVLASLVWAPQIKWLAPVVVGFCLFLINTVLIIGDQMMRPFDLQWGALPLQKFCCIMEHEIMNVPRRHADINCLFIT